MTTQKKSAKSDPADEQQGVSFEKALERLESIVTEMEAGKTGLETMIGRFEEGQKLIALCTKRLNEVERRIEILTKKGAGTETEPFDTELPDNDGGPVDSDKTDKDDPDELF